MMIASRVLVPTEWTLVEKAPPFSGEKKRRVAGMYSCFDSSQSEEIESEGRMKKRLGSTPGCSRQIFGSIAKPRPSLQRAPTLIRAEIRRAVRASGIETCG